MKCDYCGHEHDGKYASGRFCSEKCSRLYAIWKNRCKDKFTTGICKNCNKEFQVKRGTAKEWYICNECKDLFFGNKKRKSERKRIELVCSCGTIDFKLVPVPEIKRYSENYKCDSCKSKTNKEIQLNYYKNLPWNETSLPEKIRRILTDQNNKCLICNITEWNNKPIKFHLDHIDGNKLNNSRENLRLICPNCHSQTDTYCKAKCGLRHTDSEISEAILKNNFDITKSIISLGLSNGGQTIVRFRKIYKTIRESRETAG